MNNPLQAKRCGGSVQQYLSHPARAIFFITCLLIVLPIVRGIPGRLEALIHQGFILAIVAALGWFAVGCIYVFQAATLRRCLVNSRNSSENFDPRCLIREEMDRNGFS